MAEDCANPLLAQWIKEWWDAAISHNAKDRLTFVSPLFLSSAFSGFDPRRAELSTRLKRAYESVIECPNVLDHPMEATKLTGIGPVIGERLTEKMRVYCEENGLPMPLRAKKSERCPIQKVPDVC